MTPRRAPTLIAMLAVLGLTTTTCTRPEDALRVDDTVLPVAGPSSSVASSSTSAPPVDSTLPPPTSAPETSTVSSSAPTTVPPATTAAPPPPTTQPPAEPDDLVLTFDSIGPHRFGARDVDVVPALSELLGEPVSDASAEYPVADEGFFLDASSETSFIAPFGRTVCFGDGLCAQFGAGAPETLILSGWQLDDDTPSDLVTDDGIAIGATWAEHEAAITVDPFESCFQIAYADAGGIDVTLQSATAPFAAPNAAGEFVAGDPDPTTVTVIELSAGRHPIPVFVDC